MEKPVPLNRIGNIISRGSDGFLSVPHGDPDAGIADHGNVIVAVSDGGDFLPGITVMCDDLLDSQLLGTTLCRNVTGAGFVPAGDIAQGKTGGE